MLAFMGSISNTFTYVRKVARLAPSYIAVSALNSVISGLSPLILIIMPRLVIDAITFHSGFPTILCYICILLVLQLFISLFTSFLSENYLGAKGSMVAMQLLLEIHSKAAELDIEQMDSEEMQKQKAMAQEVIYRGIHDEAISGFFSFITSFVMVITTASMLFFANAWIVAAIVITAVINILLVRRTELADVAFEEQRQEHMIKMNYYTDVLSGHRFLKEIRLYHLSGWLSRHFTTTMHQLNRDVTALNRRQYPLCAVNIVVENVKTYAIYLYLAYLAAVGRITIGMFTQYFSAAASFSSNLLSMMGYVTRLSINGQYLRAYQEYMKQQPVSASEGVQLPLETPIKTLAFSNVCFRYPVGTEQVLTNISYCFQKGKVYAIVGENGSGKTTMVNLLCRLYDPQQGNVLVNGRDAGDYEKTSFQTHFAAVFQDYKNFAFTLRENITLDRTSDDSDAHLDRVCSVVGIQELVDKLPDGYDSYLESVFHQNGANLSGGEKQRIAIARAVYRDADVLIFDEPSSAMDPLAEDRLMQTLFSISSDKIVIFITHRLSSVSMADEVLFIRDHRIFADGPHQKLMDCCPEYAQYYNAQAKYYVQG